MVNESETDVFIMRLLDDAGISFTYKGARTKRITEALKTASKTGSGNSGFPEFVCENEDFLIVIEDKAKTNKQALYLDENTMELDMDVEAVKNYAENGALHYAKHIIEKIPSVKEIFAFGCSGNEEHHIIRPIFVDENNYVVLNEVDNFENFNSENINDYYREIVKGLPSYEEIELAELIKKSGELHEDLRKYGQLGETDKPLIVSAILLALDYGLTIDSLDGKKEGETDGAIIYNKLDYELKSSGVGDKKDTILNQFSLLVDRPKLNTINDELGMTPLKHFTEIIQDEIFPSISDVKADILGYFYSEFIKYSGGDGQTLGIVLTPKHITELFCDLLEIKPTDKIFDPCCGTGSFLIAGMNKMIQLAEDENTIENIKQNNIHGIEIRPDMFTIATTNMILRGDGKSNLKLEDFTAQKTEDLRKEQYTIGLMNPPYSQDGKESEMHFIKYLLDSLAENAKCAVIVPQSIMAVSEGKDYELKKEIYKNHTLEGVISLGKQTFNIGVVPCIAIFTAHQPHPENKRSKFINFKDDGYIIGRNVGLIKTERAIERKKHLLECWIHNKPADSKFMVETKVKPDDDWLHSYYYFNDEIPSDDVFKETMEEYIEFEFEMILKDKTYLFKE